MAHIKTANQEFFDALIRHQIGLLRMSGSIRNDILALLNKTELEIADKIRARLANHRGLTTPRAVQRLERLLRSIRATRLTAWNQVTAKWVEEMHALAKAEPVLVDGMLKTTVPVTLETTMPAANLLRAIVTTRPFEGRTLRQWAQSIRRADIARIEGSIKIGMIQGESSSAIARRVVGTTRLAGRNGVTEITRRQATAITRTAVNAISNAAKREFYRANADLFTKEMYVATLDSRTTFICMSLDGKKFPVGEGSIPPMHIQCRSLRVAVIGEEAIGQRPARAVTRRGTLREFSRREGLSGIASRGDLPRGFKGRFDTFETARLRELTGRIPAKVSYGEWLGTQSRAFQDDVLGPTRGRLFRGGQLNLDKFVNRAGDEIPLSSLARLHRDAFTAAGLDPEDFL